MNVKFNSQKISFSILMANYNNGNFIKEAINSVILQTYPYWELIVIDDCSNDDSINIIEPFLKEKRIKLIKHKKNIGYAGSLKSGADSALHEILAILDSDDKLHEKALEMMANAYKKNPDCGFIYSTHWKCTSELRNCKINKAIGPVIPEKTSIFNPIVSHLKTFKKSAYNKTNGFDINQKKSVDKDIIFKLEEVTKFKFIKIPLYYHRLHEGGISQGKDKYKALLYNYRAKNKTYQRRLNKNLPNFSLEDLYIEYIKLTFYKAFRFSKRSKFLKIISIQIQKSALLMKTKLFLFKLFRKLFKLVIYLFY